MDKEGREVVNLFATDPDPKVCAAALDDKRVVNAVGETVMLLGAAAHRAGAGGPGLPKPTHLNHPAVVWTASCRENYDWALEHLDALHVEKLIRWPENRHHASYLRYREALGEAAEAIGSRSGSEVRPADCASRLDLNLDYRGQDDVHQAYRMYLLARWSRDARPPRWSRPGGPPVWAQAQHAGPHTVAGALPSPHGKRTQHNPAG